MAKKQTVDRKQIVEQSLMEQLALSGANQEHYIDLIRDYMGMWDIKTKLLADIEVRGVVYKENSASGIPMMKNNPSTKELVAVNKQMLSLLKELNLTTGNAGAGAGDEL